MIVTLHDFTRLLHRFTGLNLAGQDRSKSLDPSRITELQLHEEKQDAIPAHRRIAYLFHRLSSQVILSHVCIPCIDRTDLFPRNPLMQCLWLDSLNDQSHLPHP
ncbi:hypothetical protein An11g01620 [Aspergillus niger]|uniref:Uncharacterized protein n=2 Tax=Aspergillus niger TaxID=5061 RepID=A2QVJ2_ASPNC|nr:hypothetical protein An11g01620 [Aspergillus niger]CAK45896.1 hypothetical protein An11g01620 [Aspergillus niger]